MPYSAVDIDRDPSLRVEAVTFLHAYKDKNKRLAELARKEYLSMLSSQEYAEILNIKESMGLRPKAKKHRW